MNSLGLVTERALFWGFMASVARFVLCLLVSFCQNCLTKRGFWGHWIAFKPQNGEGGKKR